MMRHCIAYIFLSKSDSASLSRRDRLLIPSRWWPPDSSGKYGGEFDEPFNISLVDVISSSSGHGDKGGERRNLFVSEHFFKAGIIQRLSMINVFG